MNLSVNGLLITDPKAMYYVLCKVIGCGEWLNIEDKPQLHGTNLVLWSLHLGSRGLSQGWEEGKTATVIFHDAGKKWLTAQRKIAGHDSALREFAERFRAWGVQTRNSINAKEETH